MQEQTLVEMLQADPRYRHTDVAAIRRKFVSKKKREPTQEDLERWLQRERGPLAIRNPPALHEPTQETEAPTSVTWTDEEKEIWSQVVRITLDDDDAAKIFSRAMDDYDSGSLTREQYFAKLKLIQAFVDDRQMSIIAAAD